MLEIDGSLHSGSGSIVRLSAAYAVLSGTPIHVVNARARRRPKPGLRRQHCKALEAARDLVRGSLEGAARASFGGGRDRFEVAAAPGGDVAEAVGLGPEPGGLADDNNVDRSG